MKITFIRNKIFILITFSVIFTIIIAYVSFFSLGGLNLNSSQLSKEEGYKIVLHKYYNYSNEKANDIIANNLNNVSYQNVMIKNNGSVYQINPQNHNIIKLIDNINDKTMDGIHFAWQIFMNNKKFYVDSTTGEIIYAPKHTSKNTDKFKITVLT
ncbi:MAG TPA: hypothetical protein VIY08_14790 [Candidatus Nitrosocosmicus sp.]